MKQIILHSLTLRNWRGEKERTTHFNTSAPTTISGGNGLGKSRHFDAFCWLLFGKDSQDRKDFELRTHDHEGRILHRCECSVQAVLTVDGERLTLKREYKEQWQKPKGQIEEVFKGNVTECTWNDVPVKVSEFQKRVSEQIIDDTLFKMLTNPRYFTERMKWQQQRECLLQMAGTATDEELATDNPDFRTLLDTLNGKSLADFRREISAEKKRLRASLSEIQPRIDQTQRMMPETEDWNALTAELNKVKADIASLDKQIASSEERYASCNNTRKELDAEIFAMQSKQRQLIASHKAQLEQEAYNKNEQRRAIEDRLKTANSELTTLNIDHRRAEERIAYLDKEISNLDTQLSELRAEWKEINSMAYDGSDICPHCGQHLPEHMIAQAYDKFKAHKADLLSMNNERGQSLASQQKGYTAEKSEKEALVNDLASRLANKNREIESLYADLTASPRATAEPFRESDIPEWVSLQTEIEHYQARKAKTDDSFNANNAQAVNELQSQRTALQLDADTLNARLAKQADISRAGNEIARLTEEGKALAQQIADIEKREYIAAEFSKKKITDCEQRISAMFQNVRFQLFDTTQDGCEFETCIPLVNGIPYPVANTASQINGGLDIISTLCRFHNVSAPIFIDSAESVNEFFQVPSQVIFLQVSDDKELVIK